MKAKLLNLIILAATTVVFAVGCDVHVQPPASEVNVSSAPPPVQVEVATPSPGPDYVWVGGAWVWGPGGNWGWQGSENLITKGLRLLDHPIVGTIWRSRIKLAPPMVFLLSDQKCDKLSWQQPSIDYLTAQC
jgi:hypothetical protein